MIEFFVRRPVTTIVFVLFFMILGIVSYFNLFIESTPKIDFPIVTISVEFPGATPVEVETQVVKKIEDAVAELSEIDKITSKSYESFGMVIVEFNLGTDSNVKAMEAKDKVEAILNDLPDEIEKPLVEKFDPLAVPVMDLILSSESIDSRELYEYADKTLKNRFSSIEGVASVDIFGGKERQINILLDPVLARENFIGITDIIGAIRMRNMNVPGGNIDKKENSISVRFMGEFLTLDDMRQMELVSQDGKTIRLGDVAVVEDGHKNITSMARLDGRDAVGLSIIKTNDGNTVSIAEGVELALPSIKATLPEGMELSVGTDNAAQIVRETKDTLINILAGVMLTVIVLYLFTGNSRTTLIAALVIPSSIVSGMFLADLSGFTINMMTLIATAMALGTLIANAIVVIEGVLSHLEKGEDPFDAAILGAKEVTGAVIASAGTNLVVFTPMAFVGGIAGPFMKQFGLMVVYLTLFSLLASFTLTPMLCGMILKKRAVGADGKPLPSRRRLVKIAHRFMDFMLNEYRNVFEAIFRWPKLTVAAVLISLIFSLFFVKYIGSEFVPESDADRIVVKLNTPPGSTIDNTLLVVGQVEKLAAGQPEVVSVLSNIGENGVENARVVANLVPVAERKRSDMDIINALLPSIAKIPGAEFHLERGDSVGSGHADLTLDLTGVDYDRMITLSHEVVKRFNQSGMFRSVSSSYKSPKPEIKFIPDQEAMTTQGVSYAALANSIRASIYGDDSNIYKENGEEYDINVEMDPYYKTTFDDLNQINIITTKGLLPITALGKAERARALPAIWHRDKERIIELEGYLSKGTAGEAMAKIDAILADIPFEKGEGYRWVGDAEFQDESSRELGKAFLLASILTFMVLAALLNSWYHPFTIGSSIITSFAGVFMFMFFASSSFNIASMLAMVMLVGLVVNNAILMLDATIRNLEAGMPVKDALWKGIEREFRAILMTSIAIVFGVFPQVFSNSGAKASMGVVLIGGMIASIFYTFVLTPVMFWYLERLRARINR